MIEKGVVERTLRDIGLSQLRSRFASDFTQEMARQVEVADTPQLKCSNPWVPRTPPWSNPSAQFTRPAGP